MVSSVREALKSGKAARERPSGDGLLRGLRVLSAVVAGIVAWVTLLPSRTESRFSFLGEGRAIGDELNGVLVFAIVGVMLVVLVVAAWKSRLAWRLKMSWPLFLAGAVYLVGFAMLVSATLRRRSSRCSRHRLPGSMPGRRARGGLRRLHDHRRHGLAREGADLVAGARAVRLRLCAGARPGAGAWPGLSPGRRRRERPRHRDRPDRHPPVRPAGRGEEGALGSRDHGPPSERQGLIAHRIEALVQVRQYRPRDPPGRRSRSASSASFWAPWRNSGSARSSARSPSSRRPTPSPSGSASWSSRSAGTPCTPEEAGAAPASDRPGPAERA